MTAGQLRHHPYVTERAPLGSYLGEVRNILSLVGDGVKWRTRATLIAAQLLQKVSVGSVVLNEPPHDVVGIREVSQERGCHNKLMNQHRVTLFESTGFHLREILSGHTGSEERDPRSFGNVVQLPSLVLGPGRDGYRQRFGYFAGYVVLDRQNVVQGPVIGFRPDNVPAVGTNQPCGDPQPDA